MQDAITQSCYREVQDLYHAWLQANDAADNSLDQHSPSTNDKNLRAIAQLALFKLRAQHVIVSLINDKSQYILAQASNTPSPSNDSSSASNDVLSGVTSQPQSDAFYDQRVLTNSNPNSEQSCSQGLDHFTSTDCQKDDRFKNHAFVKEEGGLRFALGVPLISKNKHRIGVLLVLDKSPRDGVEDTDLLDLKDCARCVVTHLELVHSSVRATKETNILRGIAECFPNQYEPPEAKAQHGKSEESTRLKSDIDRCTVEFEDEDHTEMGDSPKSIETSIQAACDSVVGMLRDRSMADGAVIFGPPAVANLMAVDEHMSPNEADERCGKKPSSSLLASSLREGVVCSAIKDRKAPPVCMLSRLASVYPLGMVFSVSKNGVTEQAPTSSEQRPFSSATAEETENVLTMLRSDVLNNLADAHTWMYLPVYDQDNRSLLASCFMWSQDDGLYAGNNHREISDYHVLGNFLSHNIAQLRMQNKDAEQRKFVSNFSHELRTPINGILGSAQFLQDTISDDYQNELLQSIVVSSNTLLDTVSNLLFISLKPILPTHVTWFWLGSRTRCFAVKKTTNSISSLTSF
jgi:GAF domain-containing protein